MRCTRPICCCAGPASTSASSITSRCSSSARRRCAPRRWRRKRSSRCCVTSSTPTSSSIPSTRSRRSILDNENRTANQTVMRLSEFLRYTLDQDPMKKVTLRQEVEAMNLYLTTERLQVRRAPAARIRHRGTRARGAGAEPAVAAADRKRREIRGVAVRTGRHDPRRRTRARGRCWSSRWPTTARVSTPGAAPGAGRGVGLRNIRERLAVLYEDRHRFATLDNKPGLRIELGFPLEMAAA